MKIRILNQQQKLTIALNRLKRLALLTARRFSKTRAANLGDIAIILVDDNRIREINRRCFFKDRPTDVITVLYGPTPAGPSEGSAEIFVNAECAWRRAKSTQPTPHEELALYIAHGLDHAFGRSDRTQRARRAMLRREQKWVRQAKRLGLLNFNIKSRLTEKSRGHRRGGR